MNVADLIEAPTVTMRPGELPAPTTVTVRASDLDPGDVIVHGGRDIAVTIVLRRWPTAFSPGTAPLRLRLADGRTMECGLDRKFKVRRG